MLLVTIQSLLPKLLQSARPRRRKHQLIKKDSLLLEVNLSAKTTANLGSYHLVSWVPPGITVIVTSHLCSRCGMITELECVDSLERNNALGFLFSNLDVYTKLLFSCQAGVYYILLHVVNHFGLHFST